MAKTSVTEQALREMVREAMFNNGFSGWSSNVEGPSEVNPNVDPSAAVTDPVNPHFTPQNKTEFGIAVNQLVKNLPDSDMPELYDAVKTTIDDNEKSDDEEEMKNKVLQGGTEQVEEQVRKAIRKALSEAKPVDWSKLSTPTGPLPPVKKIPTGVHGGEYTRWQEKNKSDIKKYLGKKGDVDEPEPSLADDDDAPASGTPDSAAPAKRKAYKTTAIGGMSDVQGASFEQIASELNFSVAGAKQAVDKALEKAQFLATGIDEDEREILVLNALNDYVKYLTKSGELSAADVQLMKDHPDIIRELDGFREFLHNSIRRARKQGQQVIDPLDDSPAGGVEDLGDEAAEDVASSAAAPAAPAAAKAAKSSYKIYPGSRKYGGKPVVTRVKGKVYGPSGETQFSPNEQGEMSVGTDGKLSVKKQGSDHTQTWDPVEESGSPKHDALVREALKKLV